MHRKILKPGDVRRALFYHYSANSRHKQDICDYLWSKNLSLPEAHNRNKQ